MTHSFSRVELNHTWLHVTVAPVTVTVDSAEAGPHHTQNVSPVGSTLQHPRETLCEAVRVLHSLVQMEVQFRYNRS